MGRAVPARIGTRNATFQQWAALQTNRTTRARLGTFLVQGVIPITQLVAHGWPLRAMLHRPGALSAWARDLLDGPAGACAVEVAAPLLAELGGRDDGPPELVAVAAMAADSLDRIRRTDRTLVVVADRPASPGNLGSLIRSADSLGAAGVVVAGHAADPYDPQAVRASRGSLFALPVVRAGSAGPVLAWLGGAGIPAVALDESGTADLWNADLTGAVALVVGNEATGLSAAWRAGAATSVRIPLDGSATSLNAAVSGSIALYEASRQRLRKGRPAF